MGYDLKTASLCEGATRTIRARCFPHGGLASAERGEATGHGGVSAAAIRQAEQPKRAGAALSRTHKRRIGQSGRVKLNAGTTPCGAAPNVDECGQKGAV